MSGLDAGERLPAHTRVTGLEAASENIDVSLRIFSGAGWTQPAVIHEVDYEPLYLSKR